MEENQAKQLITETGRSRRSSRLFTGRPDQLLVDETVRIPGTISLDTKVQDNMNGIDVRGTYALLSPREVIEITEETNRPAAHATFIDGLETYIFQLREASLPILKIGIFDYLARHGIYNGNGADLRPDYEANILFTEFVTRNLETYRAKILSKGSKEDRPVVERSKPLPVTVEFDDDDIELTPDMEVTPDTEVTVDIEEDSITGPTAPRLQIITEGYARGSKGIEVRENNRYSGDAFYAFLNGVSYTTLDDYINRPSTVKGALSRGTLEQDFTSAEMAFFDYGLKLETHGDGVVDLFEIDNYGVDPQAQASLEARATQYTRSAKPKRSVFGRALAYGALLVATAVTAVSAYLLHKEPEKQIGELITRTADTTEHPNGIVTEIQDQPRYTNEEAIRILSSEKTRDTRYTDKEAVSILAAADITGTGSYGCNSEHDVPIGYEEQIKEAGLDLSRMPPVYVCERTMEDVFRSVPDVTALHWSHPEEQPILTEKPQTMFNDPTTVASYGTLQRAGNGNTTPVPTINNVVPRIILPETMN